MQKTTTTCFLVVKLYTYKKSRDNRSQEMAINWLFYFFFLSLSYDCFVLRTLSLPFRIGNRYLYIYTSI